MMRPHCKSTKANTWSVALAVLLLGAAAVRAQPAEERFTGLNLAIVIDHSGSMYGSSAHPVPNDPYNHRVDSTKLVINRLLSSVQGNDTVHRISVIDFGNHAQVSVSNLDILYDPVRPDRIVLRVYSLLSRIKALALRNTNTPEALEKAAQELGLMKGSSPAEGRRQVVLVITDGRAYLPGVSEAAMQARLRQQMSRLLDGTVEVWLLGINDFDPYWEEAQGLLMRSLVGPGRARQINSAARDFPRVLTDILDELLRVTSFEVDGDEYRCPPYLSRVSIEVTFSKPEGAFRLLAPDGSEITRQFGGLHSEAPTVASYVLNQPLAGTYRFEKEPGHFYGIQVAEHSPRLAKLSPARATDLGLETKLLFQARDLTGKPLEVIGSFPVEASFIVTSPGSAPTVEIPALYSGQGKFEASWTPEVAGLHRVRLRGWIDFPRGSESRYDIFANAGHYDDRIEVTNRTPFYLRLEEPSVEDGWRVAPWNGTVPLRFALTSRDGSAVTDVAAVVSDPATWLSWETVDRSGVSLGSPQSLEFTSEGFFQATVPIQVDWHRGEGILWPGAVHIKVHERIDRLGEDSYLNSIELPADMADRRVAGSPLSLGPIDVRLTLWIWLIAVILGVALTTALILVLFKRTLPALVVKRSDARRGGRIELHIYDEIKDPTGDSALKFPVTDGLTFNLDGQVRLDSADEQLTATRFRVHRIPTSGKPAANLEYSWNKEKRPKLRVTTGNRKRLEGIPEGDFVVRLSETRGSI